MFQKKERISFYRYIRSKNCKLKHKPLTVVQSNPFSGKDSLIARLLNVVTRLLPAVISADGHLFLSEAEKSQILN